MTPERVDPILKASFEDQRLSRAERRELQGWLDEEQLDDHGLAYVRHRAFELAKHHLGSEDPAGVMQWLEGVIKTLVVPARSSSPEETAEVEVHFSPGEACLRSILRLITEARVSVDVCVFTITDNRITEALLRAHSAPAKVRIITDNDKSLDRGSDVERLERAGVPVRMDRTDHHMHHKFAVFDDRRILTGSYNWTRSAARYNRENIAISSEPKLVDSYRRGFEELWEALR